MSAMSELREACLDVAMLHYPKGTMYRVVPGQSWDAAAYSARRKEMEPVIDAVLRAVERWPHEKR